MTICPSARTDVSSRRSYADDATDADWRLKIVNGPSVLL
jgi:hypothetical protein